MTFQNRKPTRLKNYNYSQNGYYFITICTHNKKCIFSNIVGSIISNAMGYLKMNSSRDIHKNGYTLDVWQRSFHDHIIRGENDYLKIWNYIDTNPQKWKEDCFYIEN